MQSSRKLRVSRRRVSRENRHAGWTLFFEGVGAIAAVIAVLQAAQCFSDSKQAQRVANREERTTVDVDSLVRARERQLNQQIIPMHGYEAVYVVRHQSGFVDRETGFGFSALEVHALYPSWLGPSESDGVLSRYLLPNGERGRQWRRAAGERIDFTANGRQFFAAIEHIDYKFKYVTIRIKEIIPPAVRGAGSDTPVDRQHVTTRR
jgi:hypothetical protein